MEQLPEVAIEVKNLHVFYKNMEAYSIKQNFFELLKRNKVSTFEAVKGFLLQLERERLLELLGKTEAGNQHFCERLEEYFLQMKAVLICLETVCRFYRLELVFREI